jgi:hypothetical protein
MHNARRTEADPLDATEAVEGHRRGGQVGVIPARSHAVISKIIAGGRTARYIESIDLYPRTFSPPEVSVCTRPEVRLVRTLLVTWLARSVCCSSDLP